MSVITDNESSSNAQRCEACFALLELKNTLHTCLEDSVAFEPLVGEPMNDQKTDQFAIVELFGHTRIAGRISEQTFGGTTLVRIDVPEISYIEKPWGQPEHTVTIPAHTRSFGGAAIYAINWCDEAATKLAAHAIKNRPVQPYGLESTLREMTDHDRQQLLAWPVTDIERNDDEIPL